jgi:hypothetical protein
MFGMQPAPTARTKYVQVGAPQPAQASSASTEATEIAAAGRATRRCPYRSTRRAICGPNAAAERARAAETAPAIPYSPRSWDSMVTTPMPVIESGSRETKPAAEKPRDPGAAKILR